LLTRLATQGAAVPIFASKGYPDVGAVSPHEAARVFANLMAKSKYGAGGECTFLRLTAAVGSVLTYQAFVGNYRGVGATDDRDITLTVEEAPTELPPHLSSVFR
jgi:hypothetical protein